MVDFLVLYLRHVFEKIKKKNKGSDKEYTYYRLVHSYKIGDKITKGYLRQSQI